MWLQQLHKEFDALVSVITHGEQLTFDSLTTLEEAIQKGIRGSASKVAGEWHCDKPGHT